MSNLEVSRRDDAQFEVTFTDVDGNIVDITGGTVFFTVKKAIYDTDANAVISKTITSFDDPTLGIAVIDLTATDTDIIARSYFYDIQLKLSSKIVSSQRGRFSINQDVTIRTT